MSVCLSVHLSVCTQYGHCTEFMSVELNVTCADNVGSSRGTTRQHLLVSPEVYVRPFHPK